MQELFMASFMVDLNTVPTTRAIDVAEQNNMGIPQRPQVASTGSTEGWGNNDELLHSKPVQTPMPAGLRGKLGVYLGSDSDDSAHCPCRCDYHPSRHPCF